MTSTRERIRMTPAEVDAFLAGPHKMQLATINPDGAPHLVTMYYATFDGLLGFWTYRTSQKARNLDRDPRATCLVETGEGYDQLRGVQIQGTVERIEDTERIRDRGWPVKVATWDHRKLAEVDTGS